MAKLNGIEIKNMKSFVEREGLACQGNVYADGKLLGFWSMDGNGGPDRFGFDDRQRKE